MKDNFSRQSKIYKKYRPTYPKKLYEDILEQVDVRHLCWDCGTGNGQAAIVLANYFKKVYATDLSVRQIENATKKTNVFYSVERAEKTNFKENQFDLITVGQALHWFDFKAFNTEVKRVSKHRAILSTWGYGLLRIDKPINTLIEEFYYDIIGSYWDVERRHIDNAYASIPLDFKEIETPTNREITIRWNLLQLKGYLNSWSSVQHYKNKNNGEDPVDILIEKIACHWDNRLIKKIRFPIFNRMGRIYKY